MITRSELALVCRRLETELQWAGLVFDDVQFDEFEQTLCIVVDDGPQRRLHLTADGFRGRGDHRCKSAAGSHPGPDQTRDEPSHSVAAQASG
jgi:hypothetical protein